MDYLAAPLFSIPVIGDVFDVIVTELLYSITKSKVSIIMNLAEFIPFVDFLPCLYGIHVDLDNARIWI